MYNDFEKERKMKKKSAGDMAKFCKKSIETRHIEAERAVKRQEQELRKKSLLISRSVNNYWRKIEKITRHHYNQVLQENKIQQQQNRLLGFINKLQKISGRVADSLPSSSNKMLVEDNLSLTTANNEEITITLRKNEDNTYSIMETSIDENVVAQAAQCAELFQPKGTDLSHAKIDTATPFLVKGELREYQLIGLHWLTALHDNKINGILADEMGLGKTIQTIALLAHLAGNKGIWGPHLIVVPTTIIINWEIELKKWCPALKILSYYGNQKERKAKRYGWHKPNAFNVLITSYKLVIQDYSVFKRKRWYYIILDEAQNIKNFKSKRWQMLLNIKAKRKLLLTGTPLQNDIMEIWSYLHFLMPNLFYSNEEFRDWFHSQFYDAIHNNASLNKKLIQSLHSILRPFLLRRLKKDVEKQLPEKIEHVIKCELTRRQRYLYDEFINAEKTQETLKRSKI
jgi:SNF2 family DNA or RNA helicase